MSDNLGRLAPCDHDDCPADDCRIAAAVREAEDRVYKACAEAVCALCDFLPDPPQNIGGSRPDWRHEAYYKNGTQPYYPRCYAGAIHAMRERRKEND